MKALLVLGLLSATPLAFASGDEMMTLTLHPSQVKQFSVSVAPGERAYIQDGNGRAMVLVPEGDSLQMYAVNAKGIAAHQHNEALDDSELTLVEDAPVIGGTAKFSAVPINVELKSEDGNTVRLREIGLEEQGLNTILRSNQPVTFVSTVPSVLPQVKPGECCVTCGEVEVCGRVVVQSCGYCTGD